MHAARFFDPQHPQLLLGLLVLFVALLLMAAAAPELGSLDLSFGGGEPSASSLAPSLDTSPSWTTDPLSAPLSDLAGR